MRELASEFVRRRDELRQDGQGFRVPEDLRRLAERFGRGVLERGESLAQAARQLGVSRASLERWLERSPQSSAPAVREVVVREEHRDLEPAGETSLTLVTPEGFRIEGLARGEVVELLRALR